MKLLQRREMSSGLNIGSEYSSEQAEFLRAVQVYRVQRGRPMTACDFLAVLQQLGYVRGDFGSDGERLDVVRARVALDAVDGVATAAIPEFIAECRVAVNELAALRQREREAAKREVGRLRGEFRPCGDRGRRR